MSLLLAFLLTAVPGLPLIAGLIARSCAAPAAGRVTLFAARLAAILALTCGGLLCLQGPQVVRWAPWGSDEAVALALRLDAVSGVMLVLITFLGSVVLRFSRDYLDGDPGQARFFSWMSLTLGAVLVVVLSGHLLLLLAAWVATSLCLHRLLLHHPERAGAVFSARKKFLVSRAGDVALLLAALVLHAHHHTFDLEVIFSRIAAGDAAGVAPAGMLLAVCALLKSAQLPFHSWLPDTMETPTPVSAFMHAGIVNAGGFLVVRLSPVFAEAPAASHVLAVVGALTAAYGALVMLAQPSVKRALAYSTVAQMGFMILQCGLGAYGLALVHICAHSLYKAHAFLTAGSTIGAAPRAALPLRTGALTVGALAGGLCVALGATVLHVVAPERGLHSAVFAVVLTGATGYVIARAWSAGGGAWVIAQGIAVAVAVLALGFGLHHAAAVLFHELPAVTPPLGLTIAVGAVFAGLFLVQSLLWRAGRRAWSRRLYVHVLNGFYLGTFFNRVVARLWPRTPHLPFSS
jgi:NAD(P)H-quinone oxidoreductase subunit 5